MSGAGVLPCTCCDPCACAAASPWLDGADGHATYAVRAVLSGVTTAAPSPGPIIPMHVGGGGVGYVGGPVFYPGWMYYDGEQSPADEWLYDNDALFRSDPIAWGNKFCEEIAPLILSQGGREWSASGSPTLASDDGTADPIAQAFGDPACFPVGGAKCQTIGGAWQSKVYDTPDGAGIHFQPTTLPGPVVGGWSRWSLGWSITRTAGGYRVQARGTADWQIVYHVSSRPWTDWGYVKDPGAYPDYPPDYDPHHDYGPADVTGNYSALWFYADQTIAASDVCGASSITITNECVPGVFRDAIVTGRYPFANCPSCQGLDDAPDPSFGTYEGETYVDSQQRYGIVIGSGGTITVDLVPCPTEATFTLYNTGESVTSGLDDHWQVTTTNGGSAYTAAHAIPEEDRIPTWAMPEGTHPGSWAGIATNAAPWGSPTPGTRTFKTLFTVSGASGIPSLVVQIRVACDNEITAVRVNGTTVAGATWASFGVKTTFDLSGTLMHEGADNVLEIDVYDGGGAAGLIVENVATTPLDTGGG